MCANAACWALVWIYGSVCSSNGGYHGYTLGGTVGRMPYRSQPVHIAPPTGRKSHTPVHGSSPSQLTVPRPPRPPPKRCPNATPLLQQPFALQGSPLAACPRTPLPSSLTVHTRCTLPPPFWLLSDSIAPLSACPSSTLQASRELAARVPHDRGGVVHRAVAVREKVATRGTAYAGRLRQRQRRHWWW